METFLNFVCNLCFGENFAQFSRKLPQFKWKLLFRWKSSSVYVESLSDSVRNATLKFVASSDNFDKFWQVQSHFVDEIVAFRSRIFFTWKLWGSGHRHRDLDIEEDDFSFLSASRPALVIDKLCLALFERDLDDWTGGESWSTDGPQWFDWDRKTRNSDHLATVPGPRPVDGEIQ